MDNDSKAIADFLRIDRDSVESVRHAELDGETVVEVMLRPAARVECPECGSTRTVSKGIRRKRLRHCLFRSGKTTLIVGRRRYECRGCGACFTPPDQFSAKGARVSRATEAKAVEMLSSYNATFASVAGELGVSSTAVSNAFDRLVNPRRRTLPEILSIDECYGGDQFREPYALILMDWSAMKVVDVLEGRDKRRISRYLFEETTPEERARVRYVSIDMWGPYRDIAATYFPNARVVADHFHVMQNLGRALSRIRCRAQARWGPGTFEQHYLKQAAKLLFSDGLDPYAEKSRDAYTKRWLNEWDLVQEARKADADLAAAHDYYVRYKCLAAKRCGDIEEARRRVDAFRSDGKVAHIPEMLEFMNTLTNWRDEVAESYVAYVGKRRVSNGPIEGHNSQFSKIMVVSNGVSNFPRFRARLMLCYNKDCAFTPRKKGAPPRKRVGKKRGKYKKRGRKGDSDPHRV